MAGEKNKMIQCGPYKCIQNVWKNKMIAQHKEKNNSSP